ncbi:hypothetical protein AVEN_121143-1 [Araneus ventricosus]|uniref:Uncharacterized protein n=1 Tax=Araneus ventricosus TaxID=182803 RepID=A0A4Y2E1W8_ARAVE|nr:hypothetical protein AVEN_121143-1 [Araneus ventricosus]
MLAPGLMKIACVSVERTRGLVIFLSSSKDVSFYFRTRRKKRSASDFIQDLVWELSLGGGVLVLLLEYLEIEERFPRRQAKWCSNSWKERCLRVF